MVTTTPSVLTTNTPLKSQTNSNNNNNNNIIAGTVAAAPSKLQKIPPRLDDQSNAAATTVQTETKGLVGGVTTWFPPTSTIQVGSNQLKPPQLGTIQSPRPQYVEFLGDKKYLIIPKHNVVSVSPSVGHAHSNNRGGVREPRSPATFRGFPREEVNSSIRRAEIAQGGYFDE